VPEILPLLTARKMVVLFKPVAVAAAARVYDMVLRPVAESGSRSVATQRLMIR
jgi:hypothetical protein